MRWDRLIARCDVHGDARSACWLWKGLRSPQGYARTTVGEMIGLGAKTEMLHVAVAMEHTSWNDQSVARHGCNVKHCVSPHHVVPGTYSENMFDRVGAGTQNTQKVTREQVLEIRTRMRHLTRAQVAAKYVISKSTAKKIICGYTWKGVIPNDPPHDVSVPREEHFE